LAERFANAGNRVIIAGRRQHLVDEIVAARCGPKPEVHARHAAPDDGSRLT
jgi:short-subunit dehydrogenase involved in D-alanine esterification of teichoic acids